MSKSPHRRTTWRRGPRIDYEISQGDQTLIVIALTVAAAGIAAMILGALT